MSVLDQALTKAYDKPPARSSAAPAASPAARSSAAAPASAAVNAAAIERIYHEGGLYRIDVPAADRPASHDVGARSDGSSLGGPHYLIPPPTSPKRGVRRSLLRLLASQADIANVAAELAPPEPPRVRRKVIIRHVSHGGPIPQHHYQLLAPDPAESAPSAEILADDGIDDAILLQGIAPQIEIQGHWDGASSLVPSLVLVPQSDDPRMAVAEALVHVHLDALPEPPAVEARTDPSANAAETDSFSAKSLDDERPASIRADQAHARGPRRPHLSFGGAQTAEKTLPVEAIDDELTLADDVQIQSNPVAAEPAVVAEIAEPAPVTVPVWEVDRFHWPRTCEKLLADNQGYLASAGEKLLAAVKDGLQTLAVTGSRRGEGRTTLALCLARAAAKAGIQVALLDADFARPSLASRLGLEISHGWQDAALGHIPLSEAAVKSLSDNITVLPLEITSARHTLSLADPRVTATLRAAAATFELVIIDLGPLGPGEGIVFPPGEKCPLDATIVVRDLRFASTSESQDVGERLYEAGVEAVGVAENFVAQEEAPVRTA
jgi:Mrp family chromosome partitioning ATPase